MQPMLSYSHRPVRGFGIRSVAALSLAFALNSHGANPVVVNGGFENPLVIAGTPNWKVMYSFGGAHDFGVKGRTTASRNGSGNYGGALKPYHDGRMHAYLTQTVSNLTAGATYSVTAWMRQPGTGDEGWYSKTHVFCETVGGLGSVRTLDATNTFKAFTLTNSPDANGRIEIRLHLEKSSATSGDKWFYIDGHFDDVSIALASAPSNRPPVATGQSLSASEDAPLAITLTGADLDGDSLTYLIVSPPAHGVLTGTPPNLSYLGDTNYSGPDSFTFKVNDGKVESAPATVSISVDSANDAPLADSQSLTVTEDVPIAVVLSGSDLDGDALTYAIVSPPGHGLLSGIPPNLTYTPVPNYSGPDSFTFKVNDGHVDSAAATVSLALTPLNDAPIAYPQSLPAKEDVPLPVVLTASDAENDALTYTIVAPPAHGKLTGTPPNLTYLAATNYSGPDSFTFRVNDGKVDSAVASVNITVENVNSPPVAVPEVLPLFRVFDDDTNHFVLAPNNIRGRVIFDGSKSWDDDGDPLEYAWFSLNSTNAFALGVRSTNKVAVGTHAVTLVVSDGAETASDSITFRVLRPAEAVALICELIEDSYIPRNKQPLCASLHASIAAFERNNFRAGVNTLEAFTHKVRAQVAPVNPALAEKLLRLSRQIIAVVEAG